jgi:hypothetical protein
MSVAKNKAVDSTSSCSISSTIAVGNGMTVQHVGILKHEDIDCRFKYCRFKFGSFSIGLLRSQLQRTVKDSDHAIL